MKKIRVVHLCTSLSGGAGLCALRIMKATNSMGIDNYALVKDGVKNNHIDIVEAKWPKYKLIYYLKKILYHLHLWPKACRIDYRIRKGVIQHDIFGVFTSPITEFRISDHKWISEADIIHIHWVGGYLDYSSFFKKVKKPIVWTMHDENAGLGGFHYTLWRNMSTPKALKLENDMIKIKKDAYSHIKSMHLVAISKMMKDFISNNELLKTFPCTLIHNGIDEKQFSLIGKQTARDALGIDNTKMVFLFVAYNIHDERKGLTVLIKALEETNLQDITLICLGHYNHIPDAAFPIKCEGTINNTRLLSLYYSSADYFVMPSYQEAFAQTPMEAMACGTPVIAFPCSGSKDLIRPHNGIVCSDFTTDALVTAIKRAITIQYDRAEIRKFIIDNFSYRIIGKQYIKLYENCLKQ